MGKSIGKVLATALGRALLELGGNNGIIVTDDADLDLALRAVLFAAVGTAGQRCTTTRRLFLHKSIAAEMKAKLVKAYGSVRIGDPSDPEGTLMGPLVHAKAVEDYRTRSRPRSPGRQGPLRRQGPRPPGLLRRADPRRSEGAHADHLRGDLRADPLPVRVRRPRRGDRDPQQRAPGPVVGDLHPEHAHAEKFLSVDGSDCGIANVNIGTSGAEIGGAFGGEKETGGGREAGSDSWKFYMRRQTCTLNYGEKLPLAQGVTFDL
jgi:aldehyde dehydrogenase (NAD+)